MSTNTPADLPPRAAGSEAFQIARVLDANLNRAAEALRVVEDHARFVRDDPFLAGWCKNLRHELAAVAQRHGLRGSLSARDTEADVGARLATSAEYTRADARGVASANCARAQQALRVLEEYGKLAAPAAGAEFEKLRYQTYTLERALEQTERGARRWEGRDLYVLVDGASSVEEMATRARAVLAAGARVLQLRSKTLDDRRLLERARALRRATREHDAWFIMNDRPDLALLAQADGVHVGQEELTARDVRALAGDALLVGVSTHSLEQARQATRDGADYLGVGPVFPSTTKTFAEFPGLEYVRQVGQEIRLPWFAIGGVTAENLPALLAAGAARVAVGGFVWQAGDPARAAAELRARLDARR